MKSFSLFYIVQMKNLISLFSSYFGDQITTLFMTRCFIPCVSSLIQVCPRHRDTGSPVRELQHDHGALLSGIQDPCRLRGGGFLGWRYIMKYFYV